jgi:putative nucleotidyltransferase with HDIG domain
MINTDLISFLTQILALHDPHARSHSNHVANLSVAVAKKIGFSSAEIENLEFVAKIHDIGKIAINDFIMHKPGKFTEAEYFMVQHHAVMGAKLIETLALDPMISTIILNHHENFDGSGYPNKLKGAQIPLEARIIRITDVYDALTSERAYHPAHTRKDTLYMMEQEQNHFDPELLETFFNLDLKEQ